MYLTLHSNQSNSIQRGETIDLDIDRQAAIVAPIDRQGDVLEEIRIEKSIDGMMIGHCAVDLSQVKADGWVFSTWNTRQLDKPHVNSMAEGMLVKRICDEESGIRVALRPSWIKNTLLPSLLGTRQQDLPLLEFTAEGKKALSQGLIRPFGGNHRRAAVELLLHRTRAKLTNEKDKWENYQADHDLDDGDEEQKSVYKDHISAFEQEIGILKGDLQWVHLWHLNVWDLGQCRSFCSCIILFTLHYYRRPRESNRCPTSRHFYPFVSEHHQECVYGNRF
jgi:hypothetical protein